MRVIVAPLSDQAFAENRRAQPWIALRFAARGRLV
jgi:hypothetical protein